jgi:hypothetical protein
VTMMTRWTAIVLVASAVAASRVQAAGPCCNPGGYGGGSFEMCQVPVTKSYRVQPGFCPQQLVAMIRCSVTPDGSAECCGPHGIPPVYTAGNFVMVRQSAEGQARVAAFLTDLGAYVAPRRAL